MNTPDTTAETEIIPPELVDVDDPEPQSAGLLLPIAGLVLALLAAWLILTLAGIIGEDARIQSALGDIRTSSCC